MNNINIMDNKNNNFSCSNITNNNNNYKNYNLTLLTISSLSLFSADPVLKSPESLSRSVFKNNKNIKFYFLSVLILYLWTQFKDYNHKFKNQWFLLTFIKHSILPI